LLTSQLHRGDRIEANVRGVSFKATITGKRPGLPLAVMPDEPGRYTWRILSPREVVRKLDAQQKLGAQS